MKKNKCVISLFLASCFMLSLTTTTIAASSDNNYSEESFSEDVRSLGEKYGVTVTVSSTAPDHTTLSSEQVAEALKDLENHLIAGQKALEENHRLADKAEKEIANSEKFKKNIIPQKTLSATPTYSVQYYQTIGSYYPNGTTILCTVVGERVYNDYYKRYLWGAVVAKNSRLYSGKGVNWDQTNCQVQRIDTGRTYYVQVWGDLTEKYTKWFREYTVTSKGWRIWYEAYCPA